MRLKDLIRNNSWLSVEIVLLGFYPGEKFRISAYEDIFSQLLVTPEKGFDQ